MKLCGHCVREMPSCVRIDFDGRAVWMCHECRGGNVRNYDFAGGKEKETTSTTVNHGMGIVGFRGGRT